MKTLLVSKTDPSAVTIAEVPPKSVDAGEVRLSIDSFAVTANNVTYMIFGDQIGYWHYFDPKAYGCGEDGQGRMPVWGFATVTESKCDDVAVGTEVYGFLPIAEEIVVKPVKLNPSGFQDGSDHRAPLHPVYNSYSYTAADPSYRVQKAIHPVLRPLFTTSFLIDDFLAENEMFDAEQVILTSASSKTSLGTAFCLKQRGSIPVVGLTSAGNKAFVEQTGYYDHVVTYDDLDALLVKPTAIVDMAGNGALMSDIYSRFGSHIRYACSVGKSHWQGDAAPKPAAGEGAPLKLFFAPDYAKSRMDAWGGAGFAERLGARWVPFLNDASEWMSVGEPGGMSELLTTYNDLLNGRTDPTVAALFSIKE